MISYRFFLLSILLICACISAGFSQPTDPDFIDRFDNSLLEIYFDRAQGAHDLDDWQQIVEQGRLVATSSWEQSVLLLVEEGFDLEAARSALDEEIDRIVEERLTQ